MGERNFSSLSRSGFGPFGSRRSWTISGDWNLLLVSLQLTPLHGSERPLRSLCERGSSNRDSPTCFVIPSEAARPNRGICIWFFLELKKGNRRSHPAHLHLPLLMWRGGPPPRLHLHLLVWHGRLARVQTERASGSLPEAHRTLYQQWLNGTIAELCLTELGHHLVLHAAHSLALLHWDLGVEGLPPLSILFHEY